MRVLTQLRSLGLGGGILVLLFLAAGCAASGETAREQEAADTTETLLQSPIPSAIPVEPRRLPPSAGVDLDTVRAGRFDYGRMWTFDDPPVSYFQETYGFNPDEAWFERARLGALRIPGCTASFVSPNGLMLTNHHCSRGYTTQIAGEGENILDEGFYAPTLAEERRVPGLYAERLIAIQDVTDEVYGALVGVETDAERAQARREVIGQITERLTQEAGGAQEGVVVQVVELYNGGKYSAYTYRRYDDVRLVLIPELQLGYYGGDADNFTYPRYALDMTFWRVYEDGEPLQTEYYFPWSENGSTEGEAVFVVGNPGSTSRLQTVAQLAFRRDVQDRALSELIDSRVAALQDYHEENPEAADAQDVRNLIFRLLNSQKFYHGTLEALNDPVILARRRDAERAFLEALREDPALQAEYGGLIDELAQVQEERRAFAREYEAFLGLTPTSILGSATLRRALLAYTYFQRKSEGAPDAQLADLRAQILRIQGQPYGLEVRYLTARFEEWQEIYGADSELVQEVLGGRTPEVLARYILDNSLFTDIEDTQDALERYSEPFGDPALAVAGAVMPRYRAYQSAFAGLGARQQELAGQLGRARFEVYGTSVPPDATFTLRIADGVVSGYPYNGTLAPPYTTFYGLYDHYYSYGPGTEWDLPQDWLNPPPTFDLDTPMNLVSTNDIIGGNSGSPLLNKDLEVVGLVFDGNIESLSADLIYLTERARTVSVDSRGILETLDDMYDADRVVLELQEGTLVPTEAEADAQRAQTER